MLTTAEDLCADVCVKNALKTLADRIGPQKYNAWFKHGTAVELEEDCVRVGVPNPFVANWVEQHYQADIIESFALHTGGKQYSVVVSVDTGLSSECSKRDLDMQAEIVNRTTQGRVRPRKAPTQQKLKHSLDNFVVGKSNRLAFQSATAVAAGHAGGLNQLFVHGPCGVGKTHLLQGICSQLSEKSINGRPLRWRYVTGEQFTNEFISAVRNHRGNEFRDKFRKLDLLAIDDVHFLAAKRATQDEFLHTFNAIEAAGKQIILASDAHPRMVGDLNEGLVSRFMSGMVVKIEAPDRETRLQILRGKARQLGLVLTEDVAEYIAMHIRGSVRELEGTVVKLSALAALEEGSVSLDLVRDALSEHLARSGSITTLGDIEAVVAPFFSITPADIHSSRRTKTVSAARMIAMYLARKHTNMSFPEIGRFMGKNHSSVVLAVQKFDKLVASNGMVDWNTPLGNKQMPAKLLVEMLEEQIK